MPQITPNVKHKRNFFHKSRQPLFTGAICTTSPCHPGKIPAATANIFNESTENRVETYETPGVE